MTKMERKNQIAQEIAQQVLKEGYIDDHNGEKMKATVVAIRRTDNSVRACAAFENECYFSVNPFYKAEDGRIHLDECSIGATVVLHHGSINRNLDEAVKAYNEFCVERKKDFPSWENESLEIIRAKKKYYTKFDSIEEFNEFFEDDNAVFKF